MNLSEEEFEAVVQDYADGKVSASVLRDKYDLWFGDILIEMGKRGLMLPRVDTTATYSEKQMALFNEIFTVD